MNIAHALKLKHSISREKTYLYTMHPYIYLDTLLLSFRPIQMVCNKIVFNDIEHVVQYRNCEHHIIYSMLLFLFKFYIIFS